MRFGPAKSFVGAGAGSYEPDDRSVIAIEPCDCLHSGFARMSKEVVDRVVTDVGRDLANGGWDARHGHLRQRPSLDVGLRILVSPRETV